MPELTQEVVAQLEAMIEKEHPGYRQWPALVQHVVAFGEVQGTKVLFNGDTIGAVFKKYGHPNPDASGVAVSVFNALEGGNSLCEQKHEFVDLDQLSASLDQAQLQSSRAAACPVANAGLFKDKLHPGTFRVFNADGTFNEQQWQLVERLVEKGYLMTAAVIGKGACDSGGLGAVSETAEPVKGTGRDFSCVSARKFADEIAMSAAWKASLTITSDPSNPKQGVPVNIIRMYFERPLLCFKVLDFLYKGLEVVVKQEQSAQETKFQKGAGNASTFSLSTPASVAETQAGSRVASPM